MAEKRILNFINGEHVAAKSGKTFENRSPVDGSLVGMASEAGKEEVDAAISQFGLQLFATELLRPVTAHFLTACGDWPFYETHGENRVKEGHYDQVIRSRENVLPLMQALWRELDLPA